MRCLSQVAAAIALLATVHGSESRSDELAATLEEVDAVLTRKLWPEQPLDDAEVQGLAAKLRSLGPTGEQAIVDLLLSSDTRRVEIAVTAAFLADADSGNQFVLNAFAMLDTHGAARGRTSRSHRQAQLLFLRTATYRHHHHRYFPIYAHFVFDDNELARSLAAEALGGLGDTMSRILLEQQVVRQMRISVHSRHQPQSGASASAYLEKFGLGEVPFLVRQCTKPGAAPWLVASLLRSLSILPPNPESLRAFRLLSDTSDDLVRGEAWTGMWKGSNESERRNLVHQVLATDPTTLDAALRGIEDAGPLNVDAFWRIVDFVVDNPGLLPRLQWQLEGRPRALGISPASIDGAICESGHYQNFLRWAGHAAPRNDEIGRAVQSIISNDEPAISRLLLEEHSKEVLRHIVRSPAYDYIRDATVDWLAVSEGPE